MKGLEKEKGSSSERKNLTETGMYTERSCKVRITKIIDTLTDGRGGLTFVDVPLLTVGRERDGIMSRTVGRRKLIVNTFISKFFPIKKKIFEISMYYLSIVLSLLISFPNFVFNYGSISFQL